MRARLGRAWRALKAFGEWGLYEFWKHPGLEVYGKLADRQNLDLMWRLRRGGALEFAHYTGPYRDKEIPRILWIFWAQGEGEASPVVRRCIASWREKNADWDVRVLTLHSASEYVDLSDVGDSLPFRIRANLLRLRLLSLNSAEFGPTQLLFAIVRCRSGCRFSEGERASLCFVPHTMIVGSTTGSSRLVQITLLLVSGRMITEDISRAELQLPLHIL